jgi:thiol-disulfide isomerase/thioredoxin
MAGERLLVACLCAEWCGACREYRQTFEALAAQFAGDAEFAWIDIEDESDALGAPDIDNFPTLLVADAVALRFLGAVTPQAGTLDRLVRRAVEGALPALDDADDGLTERVRGVLRSRRATA